MTDITKWRERIAKCFAYHNMDDEGNDVAPEKFGEADIEYFDTEAVIDKLELLLQQVERESRLDELKGLPPIIDSNHMENDENVTITQDGCFECHIKDRLAALTQKGK